MTLTLNLHSTKIHAFGDKLEGIFKLSTFEDKTLEEKKLAYIQQILLEYIVKVTKAVEK